VVDAIIGLSCFQVRQITKSQTTFWVVRCCAGQSRWLSFDAQKILPSSIDEKREKRLGPAVPHLESDKLSRYSSSSSSSLLSIVVCVLHHLVGVFPSLLSAFIYISSSSSSSCL
jgi:hypothetical protein